MPDNTDAKTLDRIKALKMTRSFGDYVESSKSDCILACKNMVELTLRNPIRDAFRQFSSPVTGSFGVTITTSGDGAGQGVPTTGSNQARNSKLRGFSTPRIRPAFKRDIDQRTINSFKSYEKQPKTTRSPPSNANSTTSSPRRSPKSPRHSPKTLKASKPPLSKPSPMGLTKPVWQIV